VQKRSEGMDVATMGVRSRTKDRETSELPAKGELEASELPA
jgi:hypothetical protein